MFLSFWLGNVLRAATAPAFSTSILRATVACHFSTSELPKVVHISCVLYIFTWKPASRHSGMPFFRHLNFQKVVRGRQFLSVLIWKCDSRPSGVPFFDIRTAKRGLGPGVFFTFWLEMCYSCVQFFISHPPRWLRARRFILFDLPDPQISGKPQCFATCLTFCALSFFWLFLFPSAPLLSSILLFSAFLISP